MATLGNLLNDSTSTESSLVVITGTFTPTVTLVGGVGNTVPVYTVNSGRYTRIGNRVFFNISLGGDGGAEGAGTGQMNIALPVTASASIPSGGVSLTGYGYNTAELNISAVIQAGATTLQLNYWTAATATSPIVGDTQNNASRTISVSGCYEV